MKPLNGPLHYFLCCDCDKKNLTKKEAGNCCQGIAEEFMWDNEANKWYIIPPKDFRLEAKYGN